MASPHTSPPLANPELLKFDHHEQRTSLFPSDTIKKTLVYGTVGFLASSAIGLATSLASSKDKHKLMQRIAADSDYVWLRTDLTLCQFYRDISHLLKNIAPEYIVALRHQLDTMIRIYLEIREFTSHRRKNNSALHTMSSEDIGMIHRWKNGIVISRLKVSNLLHIMNTLLMAYNSFWDRVGTLITCPEGSLTFEAKLRVSASMMNYGVLPLRHSKPDAKQISPFVKNMVQYTSSYQHTTPDVTLLVYEPGDNKIDEYMIHYKAGNVRRDESEVIKYKIILSYQQMWMYLHLRWQPTMKMCRTKMQQNGLIPDAIYNTLTDAYYNKFFKSKSENDVRQIENGIQGRVNHLKDTVKARFRLAETRFVENMKSEHPVSQSDGRPLPISLDSPPTEKISYLISSLRNGGIIQTLLANHYDNYSLSETDMSYLPTTMLSINDYDTYATHIGQRTEEYFCAVNDEIRMLGMPDDYAPDFNNVSSIIENCKQLVSEPLAKISNLYDTSLASSSSSSTTQPTSIFSMFKQTADGLWSDLVDEHD